jgi:hypothetical protein
MTSLDAHFLDDALAVIRAGAILNGDLKVSVAWFFAEGISAFDGLTAELLVKAGRTADVLRYVESLEAGAAG